MRSRPIESSRFSFVGWVDPPTPCCANDPKRLLEATMTRLLVGLREAEKPELFRRAAAPESDGHAAARQHIGHGNLLGNVERVMQIEADDRRPQPDVPRLAGKVKRKEERRGQMPFMRVRMMLGEPGVVSPELVSQADQVGHLSENDRRFLRSRSFEMVGQTDPKSIQC